MQHLRRTAVVALRRGLLAASLALAAGSAWAWGAVGHRAIGEVAEQMLSPAARSAVAELLAGDLDAAEQPSGRTSLAQVANWADEIRGTPAHHGPWHYDNLPACGPIPATPEWCPNGQCASHQIEVQAATLADTTQPPRARLEALKWLVHLVGDVHQPLHAADNVYAEGLVDARGEHSDRGGNDVPVILVGAPVRLPLLELHGLWDRQLVEASLHARGGAIPPAAGARLLALAKALPAARLGGTPLDWVRESNGVARQQAYAFSGFVCRQPHDEAAVIGAGYQRAAEQLIPQQLALAGARLAMLLNRSVAAPRPVAH